MSELHCFQHSKVVWTRPGSGPDAPSLTQTLIIQSVYFLVLHLEIETSTMEQTFPHHVDLPPLHWVKVYWKEPSAFIDDEHSRECTMFHFGIYRHSENAWACRAALGAKICTRRSPCSRMSRAGCYGMTNADWLISRPAAQILPGLLRERVRMAKIKETERVRIQSLPAFFL